MRVASEPRWTAAVRTGAAGIGAFEPAYADRPAWDIGRPQPAFLVTSQHGTDQGTGDDDGLIAQSAPDNLRCARQERRHAIIGVRRTYARTHVVVLVQDLEVRVIDAAPESS